MFAVLIVVIRPGLVVGPKSTAVALTMSINTIARKSPKISYFSYSIFIPAPELLS